jgi:transposase-like protein
MKAEKINTGRNIEEASLATEKLLSRTAKEKGRQLLAVAPPNPEVQDKAVRRRFTAEYKLRILTLADSCTEAGSMGTLLRREGLYASNLNTWRHQRERGVLSGLTPKKRGRKESVRDPLVAENEKLRRENDRITKRLRQAEIIIDVQKKVSQILGIQLATPEEGGND